jgi:rubrerythrin
MDQPDEALIRALSEDRALAIGVYGESVAAYRYLVLAESAPNEADRPKFTQMANEEQEHKRRLTRLLQKYFPDSDFVLSDEEKSLIALGPRLIRVYDEQSFADAMATIVATEWRTARYYEVLSQAIAREEFRTVFAGLAAEGFEHHQRMKRIYNPEPA